jgi:adenosylmethionine-8-amino-7-oxononanoate aminotransferase
MPDFIPRTMLKDPSKYSTDIRDYAVRHLWHHDTQVSEFDKSALLVLIEGKGATVRDIDGKTYIDGTSRLATAAIGHGRSEIAEAAAAQMKRIQFVNCSMRYSNTPAALLAKKISLICPGELGATFFLNSGTEAVDASLKMARQYQARRGFHGRYKVISQFHGYHGTSFGGLSAGGDPDDKTPNEPLLPGFYQIPLPYCYRCDLDRTYPECDLQCARMLELELLKLGPETVSAFIGAPVTVTGMISVPPPEYWPIVREICDRFGVLLIADEVLVGFGRTGKLFACEHWELEPDIMTVGKAITSGYLPLSGAIARQSIFDAFLGNSDNQFAHAGTYSGHPVSCAAALENIAIIEKGLVEHSAEMGKRLLSGLEGLEERPYVGLVSGLGLLVQIEMVKDKETKTKLSKKSVAFIDKTVKELGLLARITNSVIRLFPPLVIEPEQVDRIIDIITRALDIYETERF